MSSVSINFIYVEYHLVASNGRTNIPPPCTRPLRSLDSGYAQSKHPPIGHSMNPCLVA